MIAGVFATFSRGGFLGLVAAGVLLAWKLGRRNRFAIVGIVVVAVVAALFHLINHAIFKASLFMAAGVIDHETGTRDMRKLNGLWRYLPHTALLAMVAAAAMAGVPLLNGFLSKEMFFSETLVLQHSIAGEIAVPLLATLAGVFAVAYSLRFIHDVFFNGSPIDLPNCSEHKPPHEPPRYMKVPIEILVVLCVLVGIFPQLTVAPLLQAAACHLRTISCTHRPCD